MASVTFVEASPAYDGMVGTAAAWAHEAFRKAPGYERIPRTAPRFPKRLMKSA